MFTYLQYKKNAIIVIFWDFLTVLFLFFDNFAQGKNEYFILRFK